MLSEITDIWNVMHARHSVRRYKDKPVEQEKADILFRELEIINRESGLDFSLFLNDPNVFRANEPRYGNFRGCRNYFVLCGPKGADESIGYYGEHIVLLAQSLGLNTCWCALTFEKNMLPVLPREGDILYDVIAVGYGETQGTQHRSKPITKLAKITSDTPKWFEYGMEAAILAPTAINQQRFYFEQVGENKVKAKALFGPCSKTDLGIVKYHFEAGAGKDNFEWLK